MIEEANETFGAVNQLVAFQKLLDKEGLKDFPVSSFSIHLVESILDETKDGIGDTMVTLILLCEMLDLTVEDCLQSAYDVISKRTGKMVDGTFIKD